MGFILFLTGLRNFSHGPIFWGESWGIGGGRIMADDLPMI